VNFFFAGHDEIDHDCSLRIPSDARLQRLKASIEIKKGVQFRVAAEGRGRGIGLVRSVDDSGLSADFTLVSAHPCAPAIDLVLAIPRPKVLRRLIPRLTSMGINSVCLVNACGVLKEYFDTHWLKSENLEELVLLGLEQGGVCHRPAIITEKRLKPFIEDKLFCVGAGELRLLCTPHASRGMTALAGMKRLVLAIGPETGWTDFEEAVFESRGFLPCSLGEEHLASDVAAIALVGAVKAGFCGVLPK